MAKKRASLFLPAVGLGLVGTVAAGWFFVLPGVVSRRVVEEAAARGVALTIGQVSLSPTRVTLERLAATVPSVPGVTADVEAAVIELSGFAPARVVVRRPVVRVPSFGALGALADLAERARTGKGGAAGGTPAAPPAQSSLERISVVEGRGSVGDAAGGPSFEVSGVGADIGRDPADAFVGATVDGSGQLSLSLDATHRGGPWLLAVHKTRVATERTLDLLPAAPGTAFVRMTESQDGSSKLVAKVAHKSLTELVAPGLTTVAPANAVIDVDVEHRATTARATGHVKLGLSRFVFSAAASPAPLAVSFDYDGQPNAARLSNGGFSLGTMRGTLSGALDVATPPPKGQLTFAAGKVPCASLARSLAEEALPGVGAALGALGLDKAAGELVTGEVGVSGEVTFDLADTGKTRLVARPYGGCIVDLPFLPKTR